MESEPKLVESFEGTTADWLLHLVASSASSDLRNDVNRARRAIRSGRPSHVFVAPDGVFARLRVASESADPRAAEVLYDVLQLLEGSGDPLALRRKWHLTGSPPTDWALGLAEFRTTKSADEIDDRVGEMLERGDDLEILIRGHLWLEYSVNRLLDHFSRTRANWTKRDSHLANGFGSLLPLVLPTRKFPHSARSTGCEIGSLTTSNQCSTSRMLVTS